MGGDPTLNFGPYRLDVRNEQLWRETQLVRLTPKAWQVLRILLEHSGQLVTKDEFAQTVWAGTVVSDAALTSCIQELRQALEDNARTPQYIETVHRRRFRGIGKVVSDQLDVRAGFCCVTQGRAQVKGKSSRWISGNGLARDLLFSSYMSVKSSRL